MIIKDIHTDSSTDFALFDRHMVKLYLMNKVGYVSGNRGKKAVSYSLASTRRRCPLHQVTLFEIYMGAKSVF